jgi:hypothetical protein
MKGADFIEKWAPKDGPDRTKMIEDLATLYSGAFSSLKKVLGEAIEILEHSDPPKGGRTDKFIKRAKDALRGIRRT